MMKLFVTLLMAALMLVTGLTAVPQSVVVEDEIIADDFDADGYDGAWSTVSALEVEIFLPDGWTGEDVTEDDVCYRAQSADGTASLEILYPVDEGVAGEMVTANGQEARLLRGDDGSLTLTLALSEDRLAGFRFERSDEDALPESMALEIAGSCTDLW